jgi:serine/threonine protein kinase
MEVTGLVLSVAATAKLLTEICEIGESFIHSIKHWNDDARILALRMSAEMEQTLAISNLLCGADVLLLARQANERQPASPLPLYDRLNYRSKSNVTDIIQEFHNILSLRYQGLEAAYSLGSGNQTQQNRFQVSWILWGKRKVKAVVDECQAWNERLFAIVRIHILLPSILDTEAAAIRSLTELKRNRDIRRLRLNDDLDMALVSLDSDQNWGSLEILDGIRLKEEADSLENIKCGDISGQEVVVDFKYFETSAAPSATGCDNLFRAEPSPEILNRLRQLAALLHLQHSMRSRLLPCRGYYRDPQVPRFGFVFDTPPGRPNKPKSLRVLLPDRSQPNSPALEDRLGLALMIAVALFEFHDAGWVHKSFRSSNIIFFPEDDSTESFISEAWLVGFDYARESQGFSEKIRTIDTSKDIYRHPDTWGEPTGKFQKIHDLYSLGIVLLEIGLWKPVSAIEKYGFRRSTFDEREDVKKLFVAKAKGTLPFMIGKQYSEVVSKCLTGQFALEGANDEASTQEAYRDQVSSSRPLYLQGMTPYRLSRCFGNSMTVSMP